MDWERRVRAASNRLEERDASCRGKEMITSTRSLRCRTDRKIVVFICHNSHRTVVIYFENLRANFDSCTIKHLTA
jgi:hypothetical protein